MTCYDERNVYKISWNNNYTFEQLKLIDLSKLEQPTRVVTVRVQKQRVRLMAMREGFQFVPSIYRDGSWIQLDKRNTCVDEVASWMFESKEVFEGALKRQMLLQFRNSAAGYYDDFPTRERILEVVNMWPEKAALVDARFSFYEVDVQEDPEFNGAFEVICDGGSLLLPYVGNPKGNPSLIPKYATFVKERSAEGALGRLGKHLDGLVGIIDNIHWSNFRDRLEGVWRKNAEV